MGCAAVLGRVSWLGLIYYGSCTAWNGRNIWGCCRVEGAEWERWDLVVGGLIRLVGLPCTYRNSDRWLEYVGMGFFPSAIRM
jgi:hypothetical protein